MFPTVELKRIADSRGELIVAENIPFAVRRAYWIRNVLAGAERGGHAHRTLHRWMVAVAGSFLLRLDGGPLKLMADPAEAVYIAPMRWLELSDFSRDAVCLVLASAEFDEADYVRDRGLWERLRGRVPVLQDDLEGRN